MHGPFTWAKTCWPFLSHWGFVENTRFRCSERYNAVLMKLVKYSLSEFKLQILVTGGAYESLYCSFQGLIDPGDEVL